MAKKGKKECPIPPKKVTHKEDPSKEKEEKMEYEKDGERQKSKKGEREGTRDLEFN